MAPLLELWGLLIPLDGSTIWNVHESINLNCSMRHNDSKGIVCTCSEGACGSAVWGWPLWPQGC